MFLCIMSSFLWTTGRLASATASANGEPVSKLNSRLCRTAVIYSATRSVLFVGTDPGSVALTGLIRCHSVVVDKAALLIMRETG